jgi:hypothetical protein
VRRRDSSWSKFDGGKEYVEADDVEITASGVLVFYGSDTAVI